MSEPGAEKRAPKVLHVVISMAVGGAERLVFDMVRYPAFAANPPAVCCMDSVGELGERLISEGYKVHCKGRRPGIDVQMITWLGDRIREERADVIHAHQYSPLFYAVPAAFLAGRRRVVYTEHGRFHPERVSWKRSLLNPLLARGVDHLVSISGATAQAMSTFDNLPLQRIKVLHNGIDCSGGEHPVDKSAKRRQLGIPDTCRIIGTAARLNGIKNIPMMLRVLKIVLLQVPEAMLVIAGQGGEEQRLKDMAVELGVADKVRFIGLRFDLPEIYQLFEVFLLTSFSEGISITLLESMAAGVPSVVTDVGGNCEVVVEAETGFLVPIDDDRQMAQRVCTLLLHHEESTQMGLLGRERVCRNFNVQVMMEKYTRLYELDRWGRAMKRGHV